MFEAEIEQPGIIEEPSLSFGLIAFSCLSIIVFVLAKKRYRIFFVLFQFVILAFIFYFVTMYLFVTDYGAEIGVYLILAGLGILELSSFIWYKFEI